MKQQTDLGTK